MKRPPLDSLRETPSQFSDLLRAPTERRLRLQPRPRLAPGKPTASRSAAAAAAASARPAALGTVERRGAQRTTASAPNRRENSRSIRPPASPRLRDHVRHHARAPAPGRSRSQRPEGRGESVVDFATQLLRPPWRVGRAVKRGGRAAAHAQLRATALFFSPRVAPRTACGGGGLEEARRGKDRGRARRGGLVLCTRPPSSE